MATPNPPKRYVVPYEDGEWPRVHEWFDGITTALGEHGRWEGAPVPYEDALTWEQAKKQLDNEMKRTARQLREYRARWAAATPDQAVTGHGD